MSWKYNIFTRKLDYFKRKSFLGIFDIPPTTHKLGDRYINSVDKKLYVYYGIWFAIHQLA